jgi:hypothetical protein
MAVAVGDGEGVAEEVGVLVGSGVWVGGKVALPIGLSRLGGVAVLGRGDSAGDASATVVGRAGPGVAEINGGGRLPLSPPPDRSGDGVGPPHAANRLMTARKTHSRAHVCAG